MRKKLGLVFLSVVIILALSTSAFAAGFALYEASARGNSLGGSMTARADDPSALFYNPAGITQLPKTQFSAGTTVLNPFMDVKTTGTLGFATPPGYPAFIQGPYFSGSNQATTSLENNYFFAPSLYVTQQLNDKFWIGLGTFSRFGLGVEWPTEWLGRFNSYNAEIKTFEINPSIAYKVTDNFSVAFGVSAMYMDIKLQSRIPGQVLPAKIVQNLGLGAAASASAAFGTNELDQKLTGDSWGYGFNVGLLYKPVEWLSLGTTYRSEVKQKVSGSAEINGQTPGQLGFVPSETNVSGEVTLPAQLTFGVAVKPIKNLSLSFDAYMTAWSSYQSLTFDFEKPIAGSDSRTVLKNWKDVWSYRFGLEYNVTDWMDLRLSYIYDESPVPDDTIDYLLPDSDRHIFGAGLGFHKGNLSLDLSYNYLFFKDRHITARANDFVYESDVESAGCHIYAMQIGYKF
jgi:long-chain fatty acid transport protein